MHCVFHVVDQSVLEQRVADKTSVGGAGDMLMDHKPLHQLGALEAVVIRLNGHFVRFHEPFLQQGKKKVGIRKQTDSARPTSFSVDHSSCARSKKSAGCPARSAQV
jgi:hypothetical protein